MQSHREYFYITLIYLLMYLRRQRLSRVSLAACSLGRELAARQVGAWVTSQFNKARTRRQKQTRLCMDHTSKTNKICVSAAKPY